MEKLVLAGATVAGVLSVVALTILITEPRGAQQYVSLAVLTVIDMLIAAAVFIAADALRRGV